MKTAGCSAMAMRTILAEKILAAISQREKLPEIGRSSRGLAEMRADWKKNAEALMNVYRSLI